jgi:thiol-disulfide isomerase/thioredoxin
MPAPEFSGLTWLNAAPLSMKRLRGKVVLVDFWTYTCVNCLRTLPHVKKWHRKYGNNGLIVVGIHSPEFGFEKEAKNVGKAVRTLGIRHPVGLDSEMKTWSSFRNMYWPCHYLIDSKGIVRYIHAGEGAYAETELWIVKLLNEAGAGIVPKITKTERPGYNINTTLETYCGGRRGKIFNTPVLDGKYVDPQKHEPGRLYLDGYWTQEKEFLENKSPGSVSILFRAKSVNIVMAPVSKASVKVLVDNKPLKDLAGADVQKSSIILDKPRMYNIYNRKEFGAHELKILVTEPVRFYAFTFG